jgi:hypothetical protein
VCGIVTLGIRGARLHPLAALAGIAVLLASPSYFLHYGALTAPWIVLTVAIGSARMLARLRSVPLRGLLAGLLLVVLAALNLRAVGLAQPSAPIPVSVLRPPALRVSGCVMADDQQILAAMDVLSRDLARGCRLWPDVTGYTMDRDAVTVRGTPVPRRQDEVWQQDVTRYLLSGDAVVVHRAATDLDLDSSRLIRAGRVLAHTGTWTLHAVSH